jgi:hypothetical protein
LEVVADGEVMKKADGRGRWKRTSPKQTREQHAAQVRRYRRELRHKVINGLGGVCACCDEARFEFLSIDHINNDGKEHRARLNGLLAVLLEIQREGYPRDRYQVLCYNCNLGRAFNHGVCPHEEGLW